MGGEEEEEVMIRRNKPRKKDPIIVQQPPPPPQPSTISSLISTNDNQKKIKKKIKKYLTISSSSFRGLGCTTGHPQQQVVSVPAAAIIIRTSANWHDPPPPPPKHNNNNKVINNNNNNNNRKMKMKMKNCMSSTTTTTSSDEVDDDDDDVGVLGCLAVPEVNVFCGPPSIGFSTDAVSSSSAVEPVVSRRTTAATTNNTEIIRQRGSYGGRRMVHPEDHPFFDTDSGIPHPHHSFGARHHRHLRHLHHRHHHYRSHEGLAEIARLQGNLLMGGRSDDDQYRDWRLDVDSMSYEELLALGDKIGYVCTGLKEDEIRRCVRKTKPTVATEDKSSSRIQTETHSKCTICQEEFEGDDEIGKLDCGHFYHMICIKQWLGKKKMCPICKVEVNPQQ